MLKFDPIQVEVLNIIFEGIENLKESQVDIYKYVLVVNAKHYYIPKTKIFGLEVIHKYLDPNTTFMITERRNLERFEEWYEYEFKNQHSKISFYDKR